MKHTIYNSDPDILFQFWKQNPEDYLQYELEVNFEDFSCIGSYQALDDEAMLMRACDLTALYYEDEECNLDEYAPNIVAMSDSRVPDYYFIGNNLSDILKHCAKHSRGLNFHLYDLNGEIEADVPDTYMFYRQLTEEGSEMWDTEDFEWDKHTTPIGHLVQKIYGYSYKD